MACTWPLAPGFLPRGGGGGGAGTPLSDFPPKIWSENNRKISITKEMCMTIDFAL